LNFAIGYHDTEYCFSVAERGSEAHPVDAPSTLCISRVTTLARFRTVVRNGINAAAKRTVAIAAMMRETMLKTIDTGMQQQRHLLEFC